MTAQHGQARNTGTATDEQAQSTATACANDGSSADQQRNSNPQTGKNPITQPHIPQGYTLTNPAKTAGEVTRKFLRFKHFRH